MGWPAATEENQAQKPEFLHHGEKEGHPTELQGQLGHFVETRFSPSQKGRSLKGRIPLDASGNPKPPASLIK
jgi:hypothetical protein